MEASKFDATKSPFFSKACELARCCRSGSKVPLTEVFMSVVGRDLLQRGLFRREYGDGRDLDDDRQAHLDELASWGLVDRPIDHLCERLFAVRDGEVEEVYVEAEQHGVKTEADLMWEKYEGELDPAKKAELRRMYDQMCFAERWRIAYALQWRVESISHLILFEHRVWNSEGPLEESATMTIYRVPDGKDLAAMVKSCIRPLSRRVASQTVYEVTRELKPGDIARVQFLQMRDEIRPAIEEFKRLVDEHRINLTQEHGGGDELDIACCLQLGGWMYKATFDFRVPDGFDSERFALDVGPAIRSVRNLLMSATPV